MLSDKELIYILRERLNNARIGSFSEHLFWILYNGKYTLKKSHYGHTDFILTINGNEFKIDVKSKRQFMKYYEMNLRYKSKKKLSGVQYPYIVYFKDKICINWEEMNELQFCNYDTNCVNIYDIWNDNKPKSIKKVLRNDDDSFKQNYETIKTEIENFFQLKQLKARIIYRTCQQDFGKESPGNFIPIHRDPKRVTIFISFNGKIDISNVLKVYALQETELLNPPTLKKSRLNTPKVDLDRLEQKFVFNDLDNLFQNFFQHRSK